MNVRFQYEADLHKNRSSLIQNAHLSDFFRCRVPNSSAIRHPKRAPCRPLWQILSRSPEGDIDAIPQSKISESGSLEVSQNFGPISVVDSSNSMIQIGFL